MMIRNFLESSCQLICCSCHSA